MKVLFIPFYSGNPYQRELAKALKDYGVKTTKANLVAGRLPVLRAIQLNGKPDVLHLHWTHSFLLGRNRARSIIKSFLFTFELCIVKLLGIKLVWTIHNLSSHERKDSETELFSQRICIRLYDQIIVLCKFAVEAVIQTYQLPDRFRGNICVIPHGHYIDSYKNKIDRDQARAKKGLDRKKIIFLNFGKIRPYKGIFHLIKEFKKIEDPQALLLVVGNPSTSRIKDELRRCCNQYKQIKTYLQFIPDEEIELYMNAADVVVLPFHDILNSGSVLLAMSFGKAVIAPSMGCIPEVIDKNGGFLYSPKDKSGLINALNQALKADLISMGQYNYSKVISFGWKEIAGKTYEVYKRCMMG
jgi:glycosyltransferase involved in cell wall biosynthesis